MTKRGMGRGLAAILPESGIGEPFFRDVPVELIRPNPDQPRTEFDQATIDSLSASIADAGLVQPLILRPLSDGRYELIAGERRWRAARQAELETVPALIRNQDEGERLQTALIENMARENLNPVDEARACAALIEDLGLSKEDLVFGSVELDETCVRDQCGGSPARFDVPYPVFATVQNQGRLA